MATRSSNKKGKSTSQPVTTSRVSNKSSTAKSRKGSSSSTHKKNILDEYFLGIDAQGNRLTNELKEFGELSGQAYSTERILNSEGITLSRLASKISNINRVNINKAPSQVDFTNYGKMYAFFTKPDLNLFVDSNHTVNQSIMDNDPDLYTRIMRNVPVAQGLQISNGKTMAQGSKGGFNNLLGNLVAEISVPNLEMSLIEGPKNMKGYGTSYVGDFWESMQETDIEISFIDTRDRDVATQLEIWAQYAEGVKNGNIFKKPGYIGTNIIDYACTIYILAVDESLNIQAHIALVGCFPRSINNALLQYRSTMLSGNDFIGPFSYTFHVSHVSRPNVHSLVNQFNYVSGYMDYHLSKDPDKEAHSMIYKKNSNGYYHHTGVTMDTGYVTDYEYHYTFMDKWAEIVGISWHTNSAGVIMYTLAFLSKDLGKPVTRESFWKGSARSVAVSRWKDGRVTGNKGFDVRETQDHLDVNAYNSSWYPGYGALLNAASLTPYTGDSGIQGVYQGGWDKWNTGSTRYGYNVNATNNANAFRSFMSNISGIGRRNKK